MSGIASAAARGVLANRKNDTSGKFRNLGVAFLTGLDSTEIQTQLKTKSRQHYVPRDVDEYDEIDSGMYGSIFSQLQDAKNDSESTCEFLQRTIYIIWTSCVMTLVLSLLLVIPIAMISVGASYMTDCPVESNIPLYLLIGGCLGFIKLILVIWDQQTIRRNGKLGDLEEFEDEINQDRVMTKCARFTSQLLTLFLFVWFVLGNYWLFSIWKPNFDQPLYNPNNWCDKTVYFATFYQILTVYAISSLVIFLILCLILCHTCGKLCKR